MGRLTKGLLLHWLVLLAQEAKPEDINETPLPQGQPDAVATAVDNFTPSNIADKPPYPLISTTNNITSVTIGNQSYSFHPLHDGPFATSQYSITCCRNGTPEPDPALAPHIHEWSEEMVGVERNKTCRRFNGYYSVPTWVMQQQRKLVVGVRCKCPDSNLDRNCRYLPDCANGGYRSFSINLRCVCPPQWFGDLCEKFCLNGVLYKEYTPPGPAAFSVDDDGLGVDRCKCYKNFYGEACDEVQCFNGGTAVKQRGCICMPPYIGPHCEEVAGMGHLDGTSSSSVHRDLSSTVVSLFLALALALGVYFLVRRRTRWIQQRAQVRRAAMRGEQVDEVTGLPRPPCQSLASPPPMYYRSLADQRASNREHSLDNDASAYDVSDLPPPPAYHEVIKSPPAYVDVRLQHDHHAPPPDIPPTEARVQDESPQEQMQSTPSESIDRSDAVISSSCSEESQPISSESIVHNNRGEASQPVVGNEENANDATSGPGRGTASVDADGGVDTARSVQTPRGDA